MLGCQVPPVPLLALVSMRALAAAAKTFCSQPIKHVQTAEFLFELCRPTGLGFRAQTADNLTAQQLQGFLVQNSSSRYVRTFLVCKGFLSEPFKPKC